MNDLSVHPKNVLAFFSPCPSNYDYGQLPLQSLTTIYRNERLKASTLGTNIEFNQFCQYIYICQYVYILDVKIIIMFKKSTDIYNRFQSDNSK